jgi:3-methyladenine DNA glycosylase AlkD
MYDSIINKFRENRDAAKAQAMAAYMKNLFPFLGISRPDRNLLQKDFFRLARKIGIINWDFVNKCWDLPEREYQYLAQDYLMALKKNLQKNDLEKIQEFIIKKSWWDTVDAIADKLVGHLCFRFPELIDQYIMKWAWSDNIWLIRSAILFQLKYKEHTNCEVLEAVILKNSSTKEFFINKAIGWALREYSKTNPQWVKSLIDNNPLHPLSVREGSKYLI